MIITEVSSAKPKFSLAYEVVSASSEPPTRNIDDGDHSLVHHTKSRRAWSMHWSSLVVLHVNADEVIEFRLVARRHDSDRWLTFAYARLNTHEHLVPGVTQRKSSSSSLLLLLLLFSSPATTHDWSKRLVVTAYRTNGILVFYLGAMGETGEIPTVDMKPPSSNCGKRD